MILLPSLAHGPEQTAIYRQKSLNRSGASSVNWRKNGGWREAADR